MSYKKLYIITGFLGAGKTTLLMEMIHFFKQSKSAVIVNEYGEQGVDGALLSKEGIKVTEISKGSIFCVCRSDLFVDALVKAAEYDVEYLLVETSGLSDPTGFDKIMDTVAALAGDIYEYKGCITVADAVNFHKVLKTAVPVRGQLAAADMILINKADRADQGQIAEIKKNIKDINPHAVLEETSYCKIRRSWLDKITGPSLQRGSGELKKKPLGNQKLLVKFDKSYPKNSFSKWAEGILDVLYRIKGFVKLDEGWYHVDGTSDSVELKSMDSEAEESYVVILAGGDKPIRKAVKEEWENAFGEEIRSNLCKNL